MWERGEGDSPPRNMRRGGSLRIRLQELSFISHLVLGHRRRSIRRAAAVGGSGRALKARPDLRLPEFGQDIDLIRAEAFFQYATIGQAGPPGVPKTPGEPR